MVNKDILSNYSKDGLSNEDLEQKKRSGVRNVLISAERRSITTMFIEQLKEPMVVVIMIAAIISIIAQEYTDAIVITFVILINSLIGVMQERKAERSLEALKKLTSPKAIVKRNGHTYEIDASELLIGDVVMLEAGRYVPADLYIVSSANLQVEESSLTGESVPVSKEATDPTRAITAENCVFMSTFVTYGRAVGVVHSIGMRTQIGQIAQMIADAPNRLTPLQQSLKRLGKLLGVLCGVICLIMFVIGFVQGRELLEMFMLAISLAVAAIPEGLPAVVTIVLAIGVQKMSIKKVIIRKLPAVETLGTVDIICSDKTGTLTQNRMTVVDFAMANKRMPQLDRTSANDAFMIQGFNLCCDAHYENDQAFGDPTELALVDMGLVYDIDKSKLDESFTRVYEIPFDSSRKLMTTVHTMGEKTLSFTKGAADALIERCKYVMLNDKRVILTQEIKQEILDIIHHMSSDALRVIALAYQEHEEIIDVNLENDLIFVGMVGMIDPPRKEVKDAIALTKKAHIKTVMITGDHKNTAYAIASQLGIATHPGQVITGAQLDQISNNQLINEINNYTVFARVSPSHKVLIVTAFQQNGHIVSMTGDGVNDAPSLKNANIGIAMGITGTDVTKEASDMILVDDNFATIVSAIEEGRIIYQNIKKAVLYLLSCNLGEIITLLSAIILNIATPLLPIHILWINLVTDTFPALALGVDPNTEDLMSNRPRTKKESIFAKGGFSFIILNGLWIGMITLVGFIVAYNINDQSIEHARTIAFMILAISQLFHSLNLRSIDHSIFKVGIFKNKWLLLAIVAGLAIQISIANIPLFQSMFKITALMPLEWIVVMIASSSIIVVNETYKYIKRGR